MEIIHLPAKAGKTQKAIELSAETGATIVVGDETRALAVESRSIKMGLRIPRPIVFRQFLAGSRYAKTETYIIDDVDELLQSVIYGKQVIAVTLTKR